jgi:GNAT superfamily N-acetyltransferase
MGVVESRAIVIEPARAADAPAVIDLIGRVFAEYAFLWDPAIEVPDLFDLEHHYGGEAGAFWVARLDGRVVGSVGVERLADGRAELHRLYLDASLRGRGVGRTLVEAVLGWCRAAGVARLTLWSDTRFDRAHRLYEGMGFKKTGEREIPDDPNDTREFGYERPV